MPLHFTLGDARALRLPMSRKLSPSRSPTAPAPPVSLGAERLAGKGWTATPQDSYGEMAAEQEAAFRGNHSAGCHAVGHKRVRQCQSCKARACEVCALPRGERPEGARCVRTVIRGGIPCYLVRCRTKCEVYECTKCEGRCDACDRERAKAGVVGGVSSRTLSQEADRLLRAAGEDPQAVRHPDAEDEPQDEPQEGRAGTFTLSSVPTVPDARARALAALREALPGLLATHDAIGRAVLALALKSR